MLLYFLPWRVRIEYQEQFCLPQLCPAVRVLQHTSKALYCFTGLKQGLRAGPLFQKNPVCLQSVENQYCLCDWIIEACSSVCWFGMLWKMSMICNHSFCACLIIKEQQFFCLPSFTFHPPPSHLAKSMGCSRACCNLSVVLFCSWNISVNRFSFLWVPAG